MTTPDEFRIPVETGKIPLELTAQMKWNIAETIARIHDNGIVLGAGDFVDVDDLKYICQATSYLMLYAQQLEAERNAMVACIQRECRYCKHDGSAAFYVESECDYCLNGNTRWQWRGVQKEE